MIFDFGMYEIDLDIEKTADYHHNDSRLMCDCLGCRNFKRAVATFPQELSAFLESLGVDPAKPEILSIDYAPSNHTMAYSGFYYLCGTILRGKEIWIQDGPEARHLDEQCRLQVSSDYSAWFTVPFHAVANSDFPQPIVALHFVCTLPWLMQEPHIYHGQLGDVENA